MARNHELIRRVAVAESYKKIARDYVWEALSLYLKWRQTEELRDMSFCVNFPELRGY